MRAAGRRSVFILCCDVSWRVVLYRVAGFFGVLGRCFEVLSARACGFAYALGRSFGSRWLRVHRSASCHPRALVILHVSCVFTRALGRFCGPLCVHRRVGRFAHQSANHDFGFRPSLSLMGLARTELATEQCSVLKCDTFHAPVARSLCYVLGVRISGFSSVLVFAIFSKCLVQA